MSQAEPPAEHRADANPSDAPPPPVKANEAKAQVGLATRRVLLCQHHIDALFGDGYALTPLCSLRQPGEEACMETIDVKGPNCSLTLRVVLPVVERTQVELSLREQGFLGIEGDLRLSTDVSGSYGCVLEGPHGTVVLAEGVLNAQRQLVVSNEMSDQLGLSHNASVHIRVDGERSRRFNDVVVRVQEHAVFELRLDSEDANSIELSEHSEAVVL